MPSVELIKAVAGADGNYVKSCVAAGVKGLVIEGMGRGNVTPGMAKALTENSNNVPIIITTRCAQGRAAPMYGYDGGGATLKESGVIFADQLPGPKARLLLMLLLGAGAGREEIKAAFEQDRY